MTSILPHMQEILDDFSLFDEWEDKYGYLIELGKKLPPLSNDAYCDENKVHGCTAQVWLIHHREEEGNVIYQADSDAFIVKGLIALLIKIYSDQSPSTIASIDIKGFFNDLGFSSVLSPSRSNGFFAMVEKIHSLAKET